MIEWLGKQIATSGRVDFRRTDIEKFMVWITIYGSDDAIRAWHNFMQAFSTPTPTFIGARLYAEFILAARRDIGYKETSVTAMQIMAMRFFDIYSDADYRKALSQPFAELCRDAKWTPPWLTATDEKPNLPSTSSSPSS